jgi:hypothetical protein
MSESIMNSEIKEAEAKETIDKFHVYENDFIFSSSILRKTVISSQQIKFHS